MIFLNPSALLLLAALPVLALLAWLARGARRREVGTLFIWRKVAQTARTDTRKPRLEPLLWLLAGALTLGALAAAQPAIAATDAGPPRVAVFIERLMPGETEPDLAEVKQRAQQQAPGAVLDYFVPPQAGAPLAQQLAAFRIASRQADARLLFLCAPDDIARGLGQVQPRVNARRDGVVYSLGVQGTQLVMRSSGTATPAVTGADLLGASISGGETLRRYSLNDPRVDISAPNTPDLVLDRRAPLTIAVPPEWEDRVHSALLQALPGVRLVKAGTTADISIGGKGVRLLTNAGETADLKGAVATFASEHPLFADLPLEGFDWVGDPRVLKADAREIALVSAWRQGKELGRLVTLSADGRMLTFAGDPFARAPAATASLLLDNALGVLAGERPSERAGYDIKGELPTERAAFAEPFEPQGELSLTNRRTREAEIAMWPAALAAVLCWLAAMVVMRGRGRVRPA